MNKLKTIFLGTPQIAVPFFNSLIKSEYVNVEAVITQPDRPVGRGLKLTPSPISAAAAEAGIKVFKPASKAEIHSVVESICPDLAIVVAYGRIIPEKTLALTKHGFFNVHFSLLPNYRGAAPVQRSLINGETETGVTIFKLDKGMDTGEILLQEKETVNINDNADALFAKLIELGIKLQNKSISLCAENKTVFSPQSGESSYAPMLNKSDSFIDFNSSALSIHNKIRGLSCGPCARFVFKPKDKAQYTVQIISSSMPVAEYKKGAVGEIIHIESNGGFIIKCGDGAISVNEVRPEGKKNMPGSNFLNGLHLKTGDNLL